MSRRGVSGWMFLLVPAHPGRPGQRAVKRSCVCVYLAVKYAALVSDFPGHVLNDCVQHFST